MVEVEDSDHFLTYYGFSLAVLSWCVVPFVRASLLVKILFGGIISLVLTFLLHSYSPDLFRADMTLAVAIAIVGFILVCTRVTIDLMVLLIILALALRVAQYNGDKLGDWLGLPSWVGIVLCLVIFLLFCLFIAWTKIMKVTGAFFKIVCTTLFLVVMTRVAVREWKDDDEEHSTHQHLFSCKDITEEDDLCPVSFSFFWIGMAILFAAMQFGLMVWWSRSNKKKERKKKSTTINVDPEEKKEEEPSPEPPEIFDDKLQAKHDDIVLHGGLLEKERKVRNSFSGSLSLSPPLTSILPSQRGKTATLPVYQQVVSFLFDPIEDDDSSDDDAPGTPPIAD